VTAPAQDAPQLTVIVPAWNAAATIGNAVASVLDQADVALECVVVDDASTDDTVAVVEGIRARDSRLVLVRSAANGGCSTARNLGLGVARGEWLAFLDADDRLLPGGLAAMLRAAIDVDALAAIGQRISTDGERTWYPVLYDQPDIRDPGVKSLARNPGLLYYAGPAGKLIHRSCAEGLEFEGRMLGDQPWILQALLRAGDRIVVVPDVVYEWRRPHPDRYVPTITTSRSQSARLGAEAVRMAARAFEIVNAAIERDVEPGARHGLAVTYYERLIRSDLAPQLRAAIRRADPDLDTMFRALGELLGGVPADVVIGAREAVGSEILRPPLQGWATLSGSARVAYWDLAATAIRIDRSQVRAGSRRLTRAALRLSGRRPVAIARPVASALVAATLFRRPPSPAVTPGTADRP
jgi:glycosyltransferase involved in cell wall biosynthesis